MSNRLRLSTTRRVVELVTTRREIQVDDVVELIIGELHDKRDQPSRSDIPHRPARIDIIQTGPEEPLAGWMRELPTPLEASIPRPTRIAKPRPQQTPCPTFMDELKRVTTPHSFKSRFNTPGHVPDMRFLVIVPTPKSTDTEAKWEPEPSDVTFYYFWTIQPILDFTTLGDLPIKSSYLYRYFHICIDILHFS